MTKPIKLQDALIILRDVGLDAAVMTQRGIPTYIYVTKHGAVMGRPSITNGTVTKADLDKAMR